MGTLRWRISTTYHDGLSASTVTTDPDRVRRFVKDALDSVLVLADEITGISIERLDEEE
jgi:hypothetical protein